MKWYFYLILTFLFLALAVLVSVSFSSENLEEGNTPEKYNQKIYRQFSTAWNGFNKILSALDIINSEEKEETIKQGKPVEKEEENTLPQEPEYKNEKIEEVDKETQEKVDKFKNRLKNLFN